MATQIPVKIQQAGADLSPINRLPTDNGQSQPVTDAQLRASQVAVYDNSIAERSITPHLQTRQSAVIRKMLPANTATGDVLTIDTDGYAGTIFEFTNNNLVNWQIFGSTDLVKWDKVDVTRIDAGIYYQTDSFNPGSGGRYYAPAHCRFLKATNTSGSGTNVNVLVTARLLAYELDFIKKPTTEPSTNKKPFDSTGVPNKGLIATTLGGTPALYLPLVLANANAVYFSYSIVVCRITNIGSAGTIFRFAVGTVAGPAASDLHGGYVGPGQTVDLPANFRVNTPQNTGNSAFSLIFDSSTNVSILYTIEMINNIL